MSTKISGIYEIKNLINGKRYIGQTSDLDYRWLHHRSDLKHQKHHSKHLQYAWNKYGEKNFIFVLIEKCPCFILDDREKYWIKKLDTYNNGYNQDLGGQGIRGYKHTEEELNKMHRIQNPKIVLQFDLSFRLIREWIGGASQIGKTLHCTKECILMRCNHTILDKMTSYKDSYWMFKDEYESSSFSWWNYFMNYRKRNDPIICQYDYNFKLIRKWETYKELKEAGYDIKGITAICRQSGTRKTSSGFVWAFDGYDFSDGYFGSVAHFINLKKQRELSQQKKVNMYVDKAKTLFVKSFESCKEASIYLDAYKCRGGISVAIKKNRRFHGYYFEYA